MDGETDQIQRRRKIAFLLMLILGMWLSLYAPAPPGSHRTAPREPEPVEPPPGAASNLNPVSPATDVMFTLYDFKRTLPPATVTSGAEVEEAPCLILNAPILPERRATDEATSSPPSEDAAPPPAVEKTPSAPQSLPPTAVLDTPPPVQPVPVQPVSIQPMVVPAARQSPQPVSMAIKRGVLHVDQATFSQHVLGSQTAVLVDFYAGWCIPCKALTPTLEEIAVETPHVRIVKVNIDESPQLAARYGVKSVPHLLVIRDGQVCAVQVGMASKARLKAMLDVY